MKRPFPRKRSATVILVSAALAALSCGSEATSPTTGSPPVEGDAGALHAGGPTSMPGSVAASSAPCPSYDDGFRPLVHAPVCSHCHGAQQGIPDWGVFSQAKASCSLIGSRVDSGIMPPRSSGLSLSAAQRALVLDWVRLGCPKTAQDAACTSPASAPPSTAAASGTGAPAASSPPSSGSASNPAADSITVSRAEWDSDGRLRIEGNASDPAASLRVEFAGRSEALVNDGGRFRGEFRDVPVYPPTVTVLSSGGDSITVPVVAN